MKQTVLFFVTTFSGLISYCQVQSKFDESLLGSIVLLEKKIDSIYVPHGTGFLMYNYEPNKPNILISCAHLFRNAEISVAIPITGDAEKKLEELKVKEIPFGETIWILDGPKLRYNHTLIKDKTYVCDSVKDIAGFFLSFSNEININQNGVIDTIKISDVKGIPISLIKKKKEIGLGVSVYFIGFPFSIGTPLGFFPNQLTGLYTSKIPNPLVRFGSVAWKSNEMSEFLLDAFSYGGNSGSPIFTQRDLLNPKSYLIGFVLGHLPSEKSENIGLARCIWIDEVLKLIPQLNNLSK